MVVLLGGSPASSQRPLRPQIVRERAPDERPEDPYANVGILVEAFVVEVDLTTLYEMGVSPLGQEPHAVSVDNILACLKHPDQATVLTGTKAMGVHRSMRGQLRQKGTTYRPHTRMTRTDQGPVQSVDYRPYETGQTFEVQPALVSEHAATIAYEFGYSAVRGEGNDEAPPDAVSWSWNGTASVTLGTPAVVGATQDEDGVVFLILTAHIVNRP